MSIGKEIEICLVEEWNDEELDNLSKRRWEKEENAIRDEFCHFLPKPARNGCFHCSPKIAWMP